MPVFLRTLERMREMAADTTKPGILRSHEGRRVAVAHRGAGGSARQLRPHLYPERALPSSTSSPASWRRSAKGESSTIAAMLGSRCVCSSAVAAPIERPQSAIVETVPVAGGGWTMAWEAGPGRLSCARTRGPQVVDDGCEVILLIEPQRHPLSRAEA